MKTLKFFLLTLIFSVGFTTFLNTHQAHADWSSITKVSADLTDPMRGSPSDSTLKVNASGTAMMIWRQKDSSGFKRLFSRYYNGVWSATVSLDDGLSDTFYESVSINDNGDASVVWVQSVNGTNRAFIKSYSISTGWGSVSMLGDGIEQLYDPKVSMNNSGNIMVAWAKGGAGGARDLFVTFYNKSTDTWSTPSNVDGDLYSTPVYAFTIILNNNSNAMVGWTQKDINNKRRVLTNFYTFSSATWGVPTLADTGSKSVSSTQYAFNDNEQALVVWQYSQAGVITSPVLFARVRSSGTWSSITSIDPGHAPVLYVGVGMDNNNKIFVVWNTSSLVLSREYNPITKLWASSLQIYSGSSLRDFKFDFKNNRGMILIKSNTTNYHEQIHYLAYDGSAWGTASILHTAKAISQVSVGVDSTGNSIANFSIAHENSSYYNQIYSKNYSVSTSSWSSGSSLATGSSYEIRKTAFASNSNGDTIVVWTQYDINGYLRLYTNIFDASLNTWSGQSSALDSAGLNVTEIAVDTNDSGNIVVLWAQNDNVDTSHVYTRIYDASTQSWSAQERLDSLGLTVYDLDAKINNQDVIATVWNQDSDGVKARMKVGNTAFKPEINVGNGAGYSPHLGITKDYIQIVFLEGEPVIGYDAPYTKTYSITQDTWGTLSMLGGTPADFVSSIKYASNSEGYAIVAWDVQDLNSYYDLFTSQYDPTTSQWSAPAPAIALVDDNNPDFFNVAVGKKDQYAITWAKEDAGSRPLVLAKIYDTATQSWGATSPDLENIDSTINGLFIAVDSFGGVLTSWNQDIPATTDSSIYANIYDSKNGWSGISSALEKGDNSPTFLKLLVNGQDVFWLFWEEDDLKGDNALYVKNYGVFCGDSLLEGIEECDDGNLVNGDGCDSLCKIETAPVSFCGDGVVDSLEECDDGNTTNGDGCDSLCKIEPTSPTVPLCGNGVVNGAEECDDGNTTNGDGCSSLCKTESVVPAGTSLCGNNIIDDSEECDDGNTADGDGCSSLCITEIAGSGSTGSTAGGSSSSVTPKVSGCSLNTDLSTKTRAGVFQGFFVCFGMLVLLLKIIQKDKKSVVDGDF